MRFFGAFAGFWLAISSSMSADTVQKPLPVEALVSRKSLVKDSASLSPDGQWFAYTVQDFSKVESINEQEHPWGTNIERKKKSDIWIVNVQTGESINLTKGVGANWGPVWSPDGSYLAFYSTRSGHANLWVFERQSGRSWRASTVLVRPLGSQLVRWMGDSHEVLTKVAPENTNTVQPEKLPEHGSFPSNEYSKQSDSTVTVYRSSVQQNKEAADNRGIPSLAEDSRTEAERADLALINVNTGKIERIAQGFKPEWYDVSPDGSHIALATWKGIVGGNVNRNAFDLLLVSGKGRPRVIASDIVRRMREFSASWSPDSKFLSYVATESDSDGQCYIVPISGGAPQKATTEAHPAFNDWTDCAPLWDASGTNLYFLASFDAVWSVSLSDGTTKELLKIPNARIYSIVAPINGRRFWAPGEGRLLVVTFLDSLTKQSGFYGIDLVTGATNRLLSEEKFYENFSHRVSYPPATGKLVYLAQDAGNEPEFWIVGADFGKPRQLTNINPGLALYSMGRSKLIEWQTLDGETIRGALLLPAGYQEGKKYPLIVSIYGGGGLSGNLNSFGLNPEPDYAPGNKQLFATRGYAVLCPDSPMGVGTPMQDLVKAVLPGVNKVIELGIADPDRLGLMGVSYGGYHMLSLLVQTPRFKAGLMVSGFGDLASMSGEMDHEGISLGELIQEHWSPWGRMPGAPWEYPEAYIENSPIFYLDHVKTPLLIVHGASDRNVASFLGDQVFVFLRRLQKEVTYAKYEGEGHVISNYANQVDLCNRMIDWFDQHLTDPKAHKELPETSASHGVRSRSPVVTMMKEQ